MLELSFESNKIECIILLALNNRPMYCYDLIKSIKDNTLDNYTIKQPTLYTYLKRLEENNYITSYWGDESRGGRRRYYKLTDFGQTICSDKLNEVKFISTNEDSPLSQPSNDCNKKRIRELPTSEEQQQQNILISKLLNESVTPNNNVLVATDEKPAKQIAATTFAQKKAVIDKKIDEIVLKQGANSYVQPTLFSNNSVGNAINPNEQKSEKEYRAILNDLIGEQIRQMPKELLSNSNNATTSSTKTINEKATVTDTLALTATADIFASKGIRLRIYNKTTANFKSAQMLLSNKANAVSAALSALFVFFIITIMMLSTLNVLNWSKVWLYCSLVLIVPIVFVVILAFNPHKKIKPTFKFSYSLTNSIIGYLLCAVFIFAINMLLLKTVFSKPSELITNLIVPLVVCLILPAFTVFYKLIYKKMLI